MERASGRRVDEDSGRRRAVEIASSHAHAVALASTMMGSIFPYRAHDEFSGTVGLDAPPEICARAVRARVAIETFKRSFGATAAYERERDKSPEDPP